MWGNLDPTKRARYVIQDKSTGAKVVSIGMSALQALSYLGWVPENCIITEAGRNRKVQMMHVIQGPVPVCLEHGFDASRLER
jgi:glycerate-2-kinase